MCCLEREKAGPLLFCALLLGSLSHHEGLELVEMQAGLLFLPLTNCQISKRGFVVKMFFCPA